MISDDQTERWEIMDLLTSLADKSLVVVKQEGGQTRYRLLESMRQYGDEKLAESQESEAVKRAHRDTFLAMAEEAKPHLSSPDQIQWIRRLEEEHDNLREGMDWSLREHGSQEALRFCAALFPFWMRQGHHPQARDWCVRALDNTADVAATPVRANVFHAAGMLSCMQGDYEAGQTFFRHGSDVVSKIDAEPAQLAEALCGLGMGAFWLDDYASARSYMEQSLEIGSVTGDPSDIVLALYMLGIVKRIDGDFAGAKSSYLECIAIYRRMGDRMGMTYPLYDLGLAEYYQGDFAASKVHLEESLAIRRQCGDRWGVAESLFGLGWVALAQDDYDLARACFDESLSVAKVIGDKSRTAHALHGLGHVSCSEGDVASARSLFGESLAIQQELRDKWGIANSIDGFAHLNLKESQPEQAIRLWGASQSVREQIGSPLPPCELERRDRYLGNARRGLDDDQTFHAVWQEGLSMSLEQAVELTLLKIVR